MPLKLIPPDPKRSPYFYVRGTHLGVHVYRSTGLGDRRKAQRVLDQIRQDIEDGKLSVRGETTFAAAAKDYMLAGHERRFIARLLLHFKETPLSRIDQAAIDRAAADLYPDATAATRNRAVYTPMSAILKRAGAEFAMRRPKGSAGQQRTESLTPKQAAALFSAAPERIAPVFRFLVQTGCRLSEALSLRWQDVDLEQRSALVRKTKNGKPRAVHLTPEVAADMTALPRDRARVFGWSKSGRFYAEWAKMTARANLAWATPHVCRHTYATWMRKYAGRDLKGLMATGAWDDLKSVARYAHAVPTDEARAADALPSLEPKAPTRAEPVDTGPEAA